MLRAQRRLRRLWVACRSLSTMRRPTASARRCSFADYAKKASSLIDAAPRGVGYPRSVAATFDLAITEAVAQCQAAEALMAYLAQCAPERIPMTLVEGAVEDEAERMKALAALAEVSLLKHDPFEDGTPAVTVHRLVQAVARARSEANGSAQDAVGRLIARLVATLPEDELQRSAVVAAVRSAHAASACAARSAPDDASVLLTGPSFWIGQAAISTGARLTPKPRRLFVMHWRYARKVLGPEHPDTATSLNNLAVLLQDQGDFAGARPLYRARAGDTRKGARPRASRHGERASTTSPPAQDQGDLAGARPLFERALAIREKALGPEHPDTATSLNNLARLLQDQGDFAGARPLFERALAITRKGARPRASRHGDEPQQPRRPAPGPGRHCGGAAALRARAGDPRKGARPRASRHGDRASTTSPSLLRTRATLRGRGRSTSAHWRYTKRRSAPSIPIRRRASTTSPSCSETRAT